MALLLKKHKMPEQEPSVRAHNFNEVSLGYDEESAVNEAKRCLHCAVPQCRKGCPVGVDIPAFIEKIKKREFDLAIDKIKEANALPAICGRVCPQENQCEKNCVLAKKGEAVAIGRLERFVADIDIVKNKDIKQAERSLDAKKVAIIGAGPAGLSAAGELAKKGYKVTIFEALHKAGGVLSYGIPEFRLPKEKVVKNEIEKLEKLGVKIELNAVIGQLYTIDELMDDGFEAIFVATGAGLPFFMNIPGENLCGVYSANEFLTRSNLMKAYRFPEYATPICTGEKVAVIGGGNVAMDAARTALRLGAGSVYVIYRRGEDELPARREEVCHAKEEGIEFILLSSPVEIIGDEKGNVKGLRCIRMDLSDVDESGRRTPKEIIGSEYNIDVDTVIMAIGQGVNPIISQSTPDMAIDKKGHILIDENCETTKKGVFAGGDIVTGAATVIMAMGAGKKAAISIDKYLKEKKDC